MKRRHPPLLLTIVFLLTIVCLLVGGMVWVVGQINQHAQASFGLPVPGLSFYQRLSYIVQLVYRENDLVQPVDTNGQDRKFQVELGESAGSIALKLEEAGLIRNAEMFRIYLVYSGLDTRLQAGSYRLSPAEPAMAIARRLQDATPEEVDFHILPGWRVEEIAAALPTSGLSITPEEFIKAANTPPSGIPIRQPAPEITSMEGFYFPDAYLFKRDISLNQMLIKILENFDKHLTSEVQQGFKNQGLTLYQGVTLASIVQREAIFEEEQPIIASVFVNRLAIGMKLDSDPTVQYALGYDSAKKSWWTNPLTLSDLKIVSLYNTYLNTGVPPGPISNPGSSALQAVAFPAKTPYYYFRSRCDGSGKHSFAITYEEHVQNGCP
jgi:UPF0755 protein